MDQQTAKRVAQYGNFRRRCEDAMSGNWPYYLFEILASQIDDCGMNAAGASATGVSIITDKEVRRAS